MAVHPPASRRKIPTSAFRSQATPQVSQIPRMVSGQGPRGTHPTSHRGRPTTSLSSQPFPVGGNACPEPFFASHWEGGRSGSQARASESTSDGGPFPRTIFDLLLNICWPGSSPSVKWAGSTPAARIKVRHVCVQKQERQPLPKYKSFSSKKVISRQLQGPSPS